MKPNQRKAMFAKMKGKNGLFVKNSTNPRIAKAVNISSPKKFREGVDELKKGGLSGQEKKALVMGKNRAKAQLGRHDLSSKEREEFKEISKERID